MYTLYIYRVTYTYGVYRVIYIDSVGGDLVGGYIYRVCRFVGTNIYTIFNIYFGGGGGREALSRSNYVPWWDD